MVGLCSVVASRACWSPPRGWRARRAPPAPATPSDLHAGGRPPARRARTAQLQRRSPQLNVARAAGPPPQSGGRRRWLLGAHHGR